MTTEPQAVRLARMQCLHHTPPSLDLHDCECDRCLIARELVRLYEVETAARAVRERGYLIDGALRALDASRKEQP